ncbi:MAG: DegV family EDD domain-containing protein [Gammaproteobacteria bacterium]|nr:DegV family EDD domain-containing protein [Gammaproteobacteria bacterium]NNF60868.1 DegV family EDD domain-containing protein [Gammaproteobacteria bacterium]NNM21743.1 DegV family EDD domain-containing protein [Gammaproteobacteria bacterium]
MTPAAGAPRATHRIAYIDGRRLSRALRAGIGKVLADQEHLNKINVYPVPDGDTGTNLALTLQSILAALDDRTKGAGKLLIRVADAAIDGARGNSGAIFAQFLQGLADDAGSVGRIDATTLTAACNSGASYAREAMSDPVEGTMLTIIDAFCAAVSARVTAGDRDLQSILLAANELARAALANTPNQLEVLRKAGVVDAGAAGFVDILDGIESLVVEGVEPELTVAASGLNEFVGEMTAGAEIDLRYRYCTECLVRGSTIDRRKLREDITALGDSLVIAGSHARMRIHMHTNEPDELFRRASRHGEISGEKADDMQRQQELAHATRRGVVITTDTAGDVPDDELERLNIYLTPVRVHFGEQSYLDKVTITAEQLYEKLRTETVPATTSQPAPGDFRRQFEFLKSHYDEVVSIHVSGSASGTWQAAQNVATSLEHSERIRVVDSRTASLGQGLLVIDAAEAAQRGMNGKQIAERIELMKDRTETYCVLRDLSYGVRGGRIPARVKTIADLLHLTPVLAIRDGLVKPVGVFLGRKNIVEKFARFIARRTDSARSYRVGVGHADCEKDAQALLEKLRQVIPDQQQTVFARIGTALGVHAGPEGLVVAVQEYLPLESDSADQ